MKYKKNWLHPKDRFEIDNKTQTQRDVEIFGEIQKIIDLAYKNKWNALNILGNLESKIEELKSAI